MTDMTLATAKPQRPRPAKRRTPADGPDRRLIDHGAWFLVLPALIPILVLSVGPLLYGIALAFTDAQSGRTEWPASRAFRPDRGPLP